MVLKVFQALPICGLPSFRNERTFVFPSFAGWRCSYTMFAIISWPLGNVWFLDLHVRKAPEVYRGQRMRNTSSNEVTFEGRELSQAVSHGRNEYIVKPLFQAFQLRTLSQLPWGHPSPSPSHSRLMNSNPYLNHKKQRLYKPLKSCLFPRRPPYEPRLVEFRYFKNDSPCLSSYQSYDLQHS